jgi:hypothetical protein
VPRYFFHITDGQTHRDGIGTELPSLAEARREAIATFGDLVKNRNDWTAHEWRIEIADIEVRTLLTLRVLIDEVQGEAA